MGAAWRRRSRGDIDGDIDSVTSAAVGVFIVLAFQAAGFGLLQPALLGAKLRAYLHADPQG